MSRPKITILIVNFNSADFVALSLYALSRLTKNDYVVDIIDNGSKEDDYRKLKNITKTYPNVKVTRRKTEERGSLAHARALNLLVEKVRTKYFAIFDADATFLIKNWDEILISRFDEKVKVFGTQAPPPKTQDFPLMFCILFETEFFKKLSISFEPDPRNPTNDTGWQLREKYLEAGLKGGVIKNYNTRNYKEGPFSEVIVAEYYLEGVNHIFASHFGRGSTLGRQKHIKGRKISFLNSLVHSYLIKRIGKKEKLFWIRKCKEIIDAQQEVDHRFEELKQCPYCKAEKMSKHLSSIDRIGQKPGIFFLKKCENCKLVFQNPRIKKEYINSFYSDDLGYYKKDKKTGNKKNDITFLEKIYRKVLKKKWNKIRLVDDSQIGKLLEVGSAKGELLELYKKKGWRVEGIESHEESAKNCRKNGLDVKTGKFSEVDLPKNQYDLIIMSMVLEHLYDPYSAIEKVAHSLKEGGRFYFSIPYIWGIEYRIFKNRSYGLHLPHHITFFSKKIIKELLQKNNFQEIEFHHQFFERDIVASAFYAYLDTGNSLYKFIAHNNFLRYYIIKPLLIFLSFWCLTGRITVCAKKK